MRSNAIAEKSVISALTGPIEKLRGQKHIARRIFFLQAADSSHANNPAHIKRTQRVDVRAMIQLVRQNAMASPMSRQKINLPPVDFSADDRIRWIPKRRVNAELTRI